MLTVVAFKSRQPFNDDIDEHRDQVSVEWITYLGERSDEVVDVDLVRVDHSIHTFGTIGRHYAASRRTAVTRAGG
jgi:hypothetical protein